jgi:predicted RNase H-like HicB family nuclease
MDLYTTVLRRSGSYWVALCLENGLIGQGNTKDDAIKKLKEAIESFEEEYRKESDIWSSPISIKELHEFLTVEGKDPLSEEYELRAVYA